MSRALRWRWLSVGLMLVMALMAAAVPAPAQVIAPFVQRFSSVERGDIAIFGNTVMTCRAADAGCLDARNGAGFFVTDDSYFMTYVDVGLPPAALNSSSATLNLPAGSTVLFAGLYWGANMQSGAGGQPAPTPSQNARVTLTTPIPGGRPSTGGTFFVLGSAVGSAGSQYHAFADVTPRVQFAGSGTYTVSNVQAGTGLDENIGIYGGWALVVAYRDPAQPLRSLSVYDGFASVGAGVPASVTIAGLNVPAAGTGAARAGFVAYDGDLAFTGDAVRLDGTALSDAVRPADNFFNSSITRLGSRITAKSPDYVNQLGFDAGVVDVTGLIPGGATSATFRFESNGTPTLDDTVYPGVVTLVADSRPLQPTVTPIVPEAPPLALFSSGLIALGWLVRRSRCRR